jgi:translation initiation factor IF-1
MAGENAFQVEGVIIEALPNTTYRVELSNGHQVLAFVAGRAKRNVALLTPGKKVKLQLSPYDLSEGRLMVEPNTIQT